MPVRSAGPSARPLMTSFGLHVLAFILLLLVPVRALRHSAPPRELDVVFRQTPPRIEVPAPAPLPAPRGETLAARRPEPPAPSAPANVPIAPKPIAPADPTPIETPGAPEPGIIAEVEPPPPPKKVVTAGLLAFKDEFARLAQEKVEPRLGADARYGSGDDVARGAPTRSMLTTQTPGTSGGIDSGALPRNVGGGRGGVPGGMPGVQVGHPESPIARIGGDDRPLAHGPGPSRTDEEIQIVFDRHKSSFYRLYATELRNDPSLEGQMVLKLTIEPDGSVSMCVLQSSDMNAPQLAEQVVGRVRTINFGAKEGVAALTIVYPIDFLPAV